MADLIGLVVALHIVAYGIGLLFWLRGRRLARQQRKGTRHG